MYGKQITVVVIVGAISVCLYMQPVKGLIKPKTAKAAPGIVATSRPANNNVTADLVSPSAKAAIGTALAARITDLEDQLKNASSDEQKLELKKQLAKQWDDDNQPAPAAFYYLDVARKENTFADWSNAGNRFNDAFKTIQDSTVQPAFVANAIEAFTNAVKLNPADLDAKTGLGTAYVNQTSLGIADANGGSPMQGIMLLLDVVKKDPTNVNANLTLGLFAMKSGQFDKAVNRFKTVIAKRPEVEPYFYLAESYKQLGMKKEAIDAYKKCREMIPDPIAGQKIDQFIKELQN